MLTKYLKYELEFAYSECPHGNPPEECLSTLRPIQSLSCLWWVRALTLSDRPACAVIIRIVCINKAKAIHQSQNGAMTASASLLIPLRHCRCFEVQTWKDYYSECRERWRAVNSDYVEINEAEPILMLLSLRTAAAVSNSSITWAHLHICKKKNNIESQFE